MIPNPWPCTTAERCVKILAIVDGVLACILAVLKIAGVSVLESIAAEHHSRGLGDAERGVAILGIILCIIAILFDIGLLWGAHKKKTVLCWAWIGFTAAFVTIDVIESVLHYLGAHSSSPRLMEDPVSLILTTTFETIITAYFIYIVYAFILHVKAVERQLQYNMEQSQGQPQASTREIPPVVSYTDSNDEEQA